MLVKEHSETIGALCKQIRLSRQIEPSDIATHFNISKPTISRIEQNQGAGRESMRQYIHALRSAFANPALTSQQGEHLLQLYDLSRAQKVVELEEEFAAISLRDIKAAPTHNNQQLRELYQLLLAQKCPALLSDDLWFDHAINGALFDLFHMDPYAPYMYDWKAWHSLATKLHNQSPLVKSQDVADHLLPPTVQLFHSHSYRYLFTTQMKHLIRALSGVSRESGMQFNHCWLQATTYAYSYSSHLLANLPKKYHIAGDKEIYVELQVQGSYPVTLEGGYTVNYRLMTWSPLPGHETSEQRFKQLRNSGACQRLYFAADYDKSQTFHVNHWPEVREDLARRDF